MADRLYRPASRGGVMATFRPTLPRCPRFVSSTFPKELQRRSRLSNPSLKERRNIDSFILTPTDELAVRPSIWSVAEFRESNSLSSRHDRDLHVVWQKNYWTF